MSIIEQAAKRLEELRRAGFDAPPPPLPETNAARRGSHKGEEAASLAAKPRAFGDISTNADAELSNVRPTRRIDFELDLAKMVRDGFVTPDIPRSRIADEFRIVKRPLIANATGKRNVPIKNGNLIMVTSSMPGEGKTFCSINLAMSIAMELDQTVLLVDADVARPSLPRVIGVPEGRGLLDALQSKSFDLDHACLRTNVEKLTILPSGTPHPRATELLASEAMDRLLDDIAVRDPNRIVIFDSPPLLVTTESRELATHMGQIVFVVKAETTLQREVKQALSTIGACPVKMILLNHARTAAQGGYGYGYSYG